MVVEVVLRYVCFDGYTVSFDHDPRSREMSGGRSGMSDDEAMMWLLSVVVLGCFFRNSWHGQGLLSIRARSV